ncbi:MAG: phage major capsid protein [Gammaproteobacteria bacterium]
MASPNLSELVTTTLRNRSKTIADNVTANNGVLRAISQSGRVRTFSGGRDIAQELSYQENSTFKYYSGYEILDVSPSDVLTSSTWDIKQAAVAVTISGLEGDIQNSGPEAVHNLLEARIENAEATMMNNLHEGIYSAGTGSGGKQITGLQNIVNATAAQTSGGIDSSTYTFWERQLYDFSTESVTASASTIQSAMQTLHLRCTRGMDEPNLWVMGETYYQYFWESLTDIQRINSPGRGQAGFDALAFKSADVIYDPAGSNFSATRAYALNTNYLFWRPHVNRNMVPLDSRNSINQDATVTLLTWAGNLTCSNRSLQGVMIP